MSLGPQQPQDANGNSRSRGKKREPAAKGEIARLPRVCLGVVTPDPRRATLALGPALPGEVGV
jgi:hypothetical protein